jgi:predicted amidophosphoribosyltransferase
MRCEPCGAVIVGDHERWECQAALPETTACPQCGSEPEPDSGFCPQCDIAVTQEARRLLANAQRVANGTYSETPRLGIYVDTTESRAWEANPTGLSGRLV